MSRALAVFALFFLFSLMSFRPVFADEPPKPVIKSVSILALKAGQTATVTIFGDDLAPKDVTAEKSGVTVKLLGVKPTEGGDKDRGKVAVALEVTASVECKPDAYPIVLIHEKDVKATANLIVVAPASSELEVKRPCGTFASAMLLPGASVAVTGNIQNDTPDVFRFDAKAGQNWTVTLLAGRGGSQLDPILRLRDSRHFSLVLAAGDDKKDRRFTVKIPADGPYFLELSDAEGRGGPGYLYRLAVTHD